MPSAQSELKRHGPPVGHGMHSPPQSMSRSAPFFTPSEQLGSWQMSIPPALPVASHTWLAQTSPSLHATPGHASQIPPQSRPVSAPLVTPSSQRGVWQTPSMHTWLSQSLA